MFMYAGIGLVAIIVIGYYIYLFTQKGDLSINKTLNYKLPWVPPRPSWWFGIGRWDWDLLFGIGVPVTLLIAILFALNAWLPSNIKPLWLERVTSGIFSTQNKTSTS